MFNLGGGEILVIMLLALIVLGPQKLPEAARKVGNVIGELRRMSAGFQTELRDALNEPVNELQKTMKEAEIPAKPDKDRPKPKPAEAKPPPSPPATEPSATDDEPDAQAS